MQAEQINSSIAGTSHGAYVLGSTFKEWVNSQTRPDSPDWFAVWFTSEGDLILNDEMYFVNEHGVWLVE